MRAVTAIHICGLLIFPCLLQAQGANSPPPDSTPAPVPVALAPSRLSWTSDRLPLRVGDLITIVVDENTVAKEQMTDAANKTRSLGASFDSGDDPTTFNSGLDTRSNQTGRADRSGSLVSVVSVRVTALEPNGLARVEGQKVVVLDGRRQEIFFTGMVRSEDVSATNAVASSRVANAEITYKGKKLGPSTGIFGKILGMLWP